MRLLSPLITFVLVATLLGGIVLAAFIIYTGVVPPATAPPAIELSSIEVGDLVTVAVTARGERVTRAELWAGDQLIAREVNPNPALSTPWSVAWQWQPPAPGVYSLAARAFDDAGRYGASSLFNVVIPPKQRLIFSSNRDGAYALYEMSTNTRATRLWQAPASEDRQPAAARARIAFSSNQNGKWSIVTRTLSNPALTELTAGLGVARRPAWSADGSQIAFEVTDGAATNVFVADALGKNRRQVTNTDDFDGQASFNPNGKQLAFAAQKGSQWDIYSIDLDGTNLTRLTTDPAQDAQPAWSPDGARIAFVSNRSGVAQVYVMRADGAPESVERLTNFPSGAEQPRWSPDGSWLAFVAYTGAGAGTNPQSPSLREIYLLYAPPHATQPDQRGIIRLTQNDRDDTEPTWVIE